MKNGDIDAIIATMTITEERKKEVDFSDVYFKAGQSLLVKKGSDIKSIDDVKKGVKVLAVKVQLLQIIFAKNHRKRLY